MRKVVKQIQRKYELLCHSKKVNHLVVQSQPHVFGSKFDWVTRLSLSCANSQKNYFGFGNLTTERQTHIVKSFLGSRNLAQW